MKYLSLFSGIGGFEHGIETSQINAECIGFSEIDKYARGIYQLHYPEHTDFGDATKIQTKELPNFDLLVGGFPCQAFSVAGKRKGFKDTRGTLFFEIARILKDKRPRNFLLENVRGLIFHDKGKTLQTILRILSEMDYTVELRVLNSKDYGVPQNRERMFIIGHLRDGSGREVLPIGRKTRKTIIDGVNNPKHTFNRVVGVNGPSHCIRSASGNKIPNIAIPVCKPDRLKSNMNGRRFKTNNEPSFALTCQDRHGVYDGFRVRRLTPIECERLQGFQDNWTKYGIINNEKSGISDTQRYKCLGNAVTTNVVRYIFNNLKRSIIV